MKVFVVDGPAANRVIEVDSYKFYLPVYEALEVRYSDDEFANPLDYGPKHVEYHIHKLNTVRAWLGGIYKAITKVASMNTTPEGLVIVPANLQWEIREIKPDFERDFEGWFVNRVAEHAPWSYERYLRNFCLWYFYDSISSDREVVIN